MIKTQIFDFSAGAVEEKGPHFGLSIEQSKTVSDVVAVTIFNTKDEFHDLITDPARFKPTTSGNSSEKVYKRLEKFIDKGEPFMLASFPLDGEAKHTLALVHIFICIDTTETSPSSQIISKLVGRYLARLEQKGIDSLDIIAYQLLIGAFCEESKSFLAEADALWEESLEKEGK